MADFKDTLILPFEKGLLPLPQENEQWLMFNAQPLPVTSSLWPQVLKCEQGARPSFNALQQKGYQVSATFDKSYQTEKDQKAQGALILASRVRVVNENMFIQAWNNTQEGAVILCAGDKLSGIQSFRKWVSKRTPLAGSLSKHHAVCFWVIKTAHTDQATQPLETNFEATTTPDGYIIKPGMFSATGPDKGSQLLISHFDERIRGHVADFGAGWGYLSNELLKRSPHITKLNLYEADWQSLQAAEQNIKSHQQTHRVAHQDIDIQNHWVDLVHEAPKGPFNWVIMNPPFHTGRASEPDLGIKFIEAASRCLPAGGRLLMVANRNLPYEQSIRRFFKKMEMKDDAGGFKVIEAVKSSTP